MKIFVIYDSNGFVWERAHPSLQSVVDVVSIYVEQENFRAKEDESSNYYPIEMQKEFTYKYIEGGVLVAHNAYNKFSIFFKELTL
jgi:hypothetical protein